MLPTRDCVRVRVGLSPIVSLSLSSECVRVVVNVLYRAVAIAGCRLNFSTHLTRKIAYACVAFRRVIIDRSAARNHMHMCSTLYVHKIRTRCMGWCLEGRSRSFARHWVNVVLAQTDSRTRRVHFGVCTFLCGWNVWMDVFGCCEMFRPLCILFLVAIMKNVLSYSE